MSGTVLYLRSRQIAATTGALTLIAAVGWFLGSRSIQLREDSARAVPWAVLLPLASAIVIIYSARSPMNEFERAAMRSMPFVRVLHLSALLLLSVFATWLVLRGVSGATSLVAGLRNLVGFSGLGLLMARAFGARLGWLLPAGWAFCALSTGGDGMWVGLYSWPIQPNGDSRAASLAAAFLVLGVYVVCAWGTREAPGERE